MYLTKYRIHLLELHVFLRGVVPVCVHRGDNFSPGVQEDGAHTSKSASDDHGS